MCNRNHSWSGIRAIFYKYPFTAIQSLERFSTFIGRVFFGRVRHLMHAYEILAGFKRNTMTAHWRTNILTGENKHPFTVVSEKLRSAFGRVSPSKTHYRVHMKNNRRIEGGGQTWGGGRSAMEHSSSSPGFSLSGIATRAIDQTISAKMKRHSSSPYASFSLTTNHGLFSQGSISLLMVVVLSLLRYPALPLVSSSIPLQHNKAAVGHQVVLPFLRHPALPFVSPSLPVKHGRS